jgi:hypothetical protein
VDSRDHLGCDVGTGVGSQSRELSGSWSGVLPVSAVTDGIRSKPYVRSVSYLSVTIFSKLSGGFSMLWLAIILLVAWVLGWGVFHVAGGLIHLLLVIAVIVFIYNLVTGRRRV